MRIFGVDHPSTGYVAPLEIMNNVAELAEKVGALDRDNIVAGGLASGKFAVNAWSVITRDTRTTAQDLDLPETHGVGDEYPIPDDAGDPWRIEFDTQDGFVAGTFSITFDVALASGPTAYNAFVWVGVRIDGLLVGMSPPGEHAMSSDSVSVDFATPVPAGSHVAELVCGFAVDGVASDTITITFNDGTFLAVGAHR